MFKSFVSDFLLSSKLIYFNKYVLGLTSILFVCFISVFLFVGFKEDERISVGIVESELVLYNTVLFELRDNSLLDISTGGLDELENDLDSKKIDVMVLILRTGISFEYMPDDLTNARIVGDIINNSISKNVLNVNGLTPPEYVDLDKVDGLGQNIEYIISIFLTVLLAVIVFKFFVLDVLRYKDNKLAKVFNPIYNCNLLVTMKYITFLWGVYFIFLTSLISIILFYNYNTVYISNVLGVGVSSYLLIVILALLAAIVYRLKVSYVSKLLIWLGFAVLQAWIMESFIFNDSVGVNLPIGGFVDLLKSSFSNSDLSVLFISGKLFMMTCWILFLFIVYNVVKKFDKGY